MFTVDANTGAIQMHSGDTGAFVAAARRTDDVDFTWEKYEASYNELANDLGNLVQRLATLCKKNEIL